MSVGFSVSGSSQKEDVFASGCELGQLVKGVASTLSSSNSVASSLGELEGANSKSFGDVEESDVVGD